MDFGFLCAFVHRFSIRLVTCESLPSLLTPPTPPPLLVLRQGRHASWMPNSPLSGHRATAAVAAIIRVNYSLSWCCVHITQPRIHVRVCCLLCESSGLWQSLQFAASHLIKAEVSVGGWGSKYYHCCLTCETLKCVANLGLSSCCPHPVCVFLDPGGSLMFQKDCSLLIEVLKISCPQDCGYQPAASRLILILLLTLLRGKILTLKLLQNQQMYVLRSLCTGGHSLPERIESICLLYATITFNPRCFRVAELCFYKYASS